MFEDIAGELDERTFEEGELLLEEGKETPNVYILKEGALVVSIDGEEVNRVCNPETIFGEVSVLLESESTATVKALEPTTAWVIEDLGRFMDTHPTFARTVAKELARRLCNVNFSVSEMRASFKQLEERIREKGADEPTVELNRSASALLKLEANRPAPTGKPTEEKAGKKKSVRGLLSRLNEILNKPIF